MASPSPLISLDKVSLTFEGNQVLQAVSLTVAPAEIVTLIGPNGAGKSSLVKLVTGLVLPSAGKISRAAKLRIGYMPQRLKLEPSLPMTTRRFLDLASKDKKALDACCERLDISALLNTPLNNLSGGELQRILLARAILRRPNLLILDEPTQGVDVTGQAELYRIITELRDELGCGVLMVSHDLHLVMAQTDTVYCLNRHVCCQGAPESVSQHPEYLELFGKEAAEEIAVYTHHHDHEHKLSGEVVGGGCQHNHD